MSPGRDGRDKLLRLARHQTPPPDVCGAFDARDLGLALGLENAIHAVLLKGGRAGLWGLLIVEEVLQGGLVLGLQRLLKSLDDRVDRSVVFSV